MTGAPGRGTVWAMEHWDLRTLDVQPHQPQILDSKRGESRTIALRLRAGEGLQEHQVHERAHVIVVDGEIVGVSQMHVSRLIRQSIARLRTEAEER